MKCNMCDCEIDFNYANDIDQAIDMLFCCDSCKFWLDKLDENGILKDGMILYKDNIYWVGPEGKSYKYGRGFGGRRFEIVKDNITIITTNLWHNGQIPEKLRSLFKKNKEVIIK